MAERNIIVECYGDSLLIKQMGYDCLPLHSGIGEVANQMNKYFKNRFVIGIYDSDKTSIPSYFTKKIHPLSLPKHNVQLIKCQGKFHYTIKIIPAFEGFITKAGLAAGYSRTDFKLPADEKEFRKLCKDMKLHKDSRMINFINAIIAQNPPQIKALREAINSAKKNTPK